MDILEKFLRNISYKFPKGYPDINDAQDMLMLEGILKGMGIELLESYDKLAPETKKVADDVLQLLGFDKDQVRASSKTKFTIYSDISRDVLVDKVEDSGKFGKRGGTKEDTRGNFKVNGITFLFKPLKTSGEYYNLKPQQMGLTVDKYISLDQLSSELKKGIQSNDRLSDTQKKFLTALVDNQDTLTPEEKQEIFDDNRFYGEFLKNFGEPIGALEYAKSIGSNEVFFPGKGNYPLIDYLVKKDEGVVQVSAKTAKGSGNTVKLPDLIKQIKSTGDTPDPNLVKINDIIAGNSVKTGAIELIKQYGDSGLKSKLEVFLDKYPDYASRRLSRDETLERVTLEREIVKQLNAKFSPIFSKAFNDYVDVKYIKYKPNPSNLEPTLNITDGERFKISLRTKNSSGHDSDKIGFDVKTLR